MTCTLHINKTKNTQIPETIPRNPPTGGIINGPIQCGFCSQDLSVFATIAQREMHYEHHFAQGSGSQKGMEQPTWATTLTSSFSHKPNRLKRNSIFTPQEMDGFWHTARSGPPPTNFNPGFIPLLEDALRKSHDRGDSRHAALCYKNSVHIRREKWDTGWGCGYRNFMMACAALMDQPIQTSYRLLLEEPIPPSVRNLQTWIEAAWADGFDVEGARDLRKLVGTSKWLGASDLWVAFSYRGIPAELVDFDLKHQRDVQVITDWVVNYFTPEPHADKGAAQLAPVVITDKIPLILQHDGHSRTIVGYEVTKTGLVNLLMFDPSFIPSKRIRQAGLACYDGTPVKPKKPQSTLHSFFHTRPTSDRDSSNRKRSAGTSLQPSLKRQRSVAVASKGGEDGGVVYIREPQDQEHTRAEIPNEQKTRNDKSESYRACELTPVDILKHFRLDPKKLGRKKEYQVLYFPLTPPLTQEAKANRKVVKSKKFC